MPRKLPKSLNELFLPIKLITHHLYYNCDGYLWNKAQIGILPFQVAQEKSC